jgi:glycosyltransferase involved in cell wall biosynthesis
MIYTCADNKNSARLNHKLVIVCSGPTTTSRKVHLQKITELITSIIRKTIIISEDMDPIILTASKYWYSESFKRSVDKKERKQFIFRLIEIINGELRKSKLLFSYVSKGDFVLFLGIYQPLSLITVKLRRGLPIIFGGGFDISRSATGNKFLDVLYFAFRWAFQITMLKVFSRIILESKSVKDFYNLEGLDKKIYYAHLHLSSAFTLANSFNKRDIDLAFMGVLSKEKGIIEFLKSCSILKNKNMAIRVVIWGDGVLKDQVERYIDENNLSTLVQLKNFIDSHEVPKMLNKIKLLAIPSYSEGLPNRLLEAMACGTPVLVTPVGGVPDVVKEGETGFLLKSNNPKHMAERITELLNKPELLEKVSITAHNYIRKSFGYEKTLEAWRKILSELNA